MTVEPPNHPQCRSELSFDDLADRRPVPAAVALMAGLFAFVVVMFSVIRWLF